MSKFKTKIPVDIKGVVDKLPKGHFVHGIELDADRQSVTLLWEHDHFVTLYSIPVEFSVEAIQGTQPMPGVVKLKAEPKESDRGTNDAVAEPAKSKAKVRK